MSLTQSDFNFERDVKFEKEIKNKTIARPDV